MDNTFSTPLLVQPLKLGAEVATPEDARLLARAGSDSIQCERFTCADLEETVRGVKAVNAAVQVLAAGGVTGENAAAVAATGVDVLVTTWAYFGKPADIKMVVSAYRLRGLHPFGL